VVVTEASDNFRGISFFFADSSVITDPIRFGVVGFENCWFVLFTVDSLTS
jgi:hypothetical protein